VLDLLRDDERAEADRFLAEYAAIRAREPWADRARARRTSAVAAAMALIRHETGAYALVADVGSGVTEDEVIAIDLAEPAAPRGIAVRGDMRRLPLREASVDGLLYAASLHYAPIDDGIGEATRVLRVAGVLVALDSPIYRGAEAARRAAQRSAAYYTEVGHPGLQAHYHPIELGALRQALVANHFEVLRLHTGSPWGRLLRRGPESFVLARRLR
jgi:SAM-dependent methyltransferase